jgi:hypothetical protein
MEEITAKRENGAVDISLSENAGPESCGESQMLRVSEANTHRNLLRESRVAIDLSLFAESDFRFLVKASRVGECDLGSHPRCLIWIS